MHPDPRERLQGRSADGSREPVRIIEHPDVRKMLLTGQALTKAGRALAVFTALQMDVAERHPDQDRRRKAEGLVALLTPVVKAAFTDFGFEITVQSQHVFGGHGYIREWGMEQYVRDARIAQIYEGTNGVQAMDLVSRKLPLEDGAVARGFFDLMRADIVRAKGVPQFDSTIQAVEGALGRLEKLTDELVAKRGDAVELGASATDYLGFVALVSFAWMWVRMAASCDRDTSAKPHCRSISALARFFAARVLPQTQALDAAIHSGATETMALADELLRADQSRR
ncbi:hypothetical protein CBW24_16700 (plasmid) [Pacificitalea manganoxidans]|jgi:hypothetical protein|uniref:Acyl-CoA dehydrogenase n=1 Tax=Pacificitalea manganoxidans TaxID=1411902 RepID=A0A291M4D3_9RHOB|nr:hypothetical protein CBW24_16700 [Pacificitalea manganoxidans]MBA97545.1 hypothetical protein [Roseobacter sp.]MBV50216.1 hypothetical protein [Roseobacter sp.]